VRAFFKDREEKQSAALFPLLLMVNFLEKLMWRFAIFRSKTKGER